MVIVFNYNTRYYKDNSSCKRMMSLMSFNPQNEDSEVMKKIKRTK